MTFLGPSSQFGGRLPPRASKTQCHVKISKPLLSRGHSPGFTRPSISHDRFFRAKRKCHEGLGKSDQDKNRFRRFNVWLAVIVCIAAADEASDAATLDWLSDDRDRSSGLFSLLLYPQTRRRLTAPDSRIAKQQRLQTPWSIPPNVRLSMEAGVGDTC